MGWPRWTTWRTVRVATFLGSSNGQSSTLALSAAAVLLLLPRVVVRVHVVELEWTHCEDDDDRLLLREGEVVHLGRGDHESAGFDRLGGVRVELVPQPHVQGAGNDDHVLIGRVRVGRDLVICGQLRGDGEYFLAGWVPFQDGGLGPRGEHWWRVAPTDVLGTEQDVSMR